MDFNNNNDIDMWQCREDGLYLQNDFKLDSTSQSIWNNVDENSNDFFSWEMHTPIRGCGDIGFDWELGDNKNKSPEPRESSQSKRRRMLQFTNDAPELNFGNDQTTYSPSSYQELENLSLADEFLKCFEDDPELNKDLIDDTGAITNESLTQSSEGCTDNSVSEIEMHQSCKEIPLSVDDYVASNNLIKIPDPINLRYEMGSVKPKEKAKLSVCKISRGKKSSMMHTPTKLTTAVAYPFTLVKPCGNEGDVTTLKDINQRIQEKRPVEQQYPTSAFSGKPVVAKTKIRTLGGKGSITIMRTKG